MRTRFGSLLILFILPLAGWMLGAPSAVHAADDAIAGEAGMYAITTWDEDCDGDTRSAWDNLVSAWFNELRNDDPIPDGHGPAAWSRLFGQIYADGLTFDSDFVDPDNQAWGNDTGHADAVDALMVGLHGGDNSSDHRWYGLLKWNEPGSGNCFAYQGHMELGDGDLEFLLLSSCFSMDREDWWSEWNSTFDGLHQIDGFHGIMFVDPDFESRYRHFADDAFWISIADAWMDNLYVEDDFVSNHDQCPVARVVGTNLEDSRIRMNTERFNHILDDPPGLGQSRTHRARYIRGCNPRGMEALPQ
jgi:hypothetical protein